MKTRTLISIENVFKGVFIGLLFVAALRAQLWREPLYVLAASTGLLVLVLSLQSIRQRWGIKRSRRHLLATVILALLDHPGTVYATLIGGYLVGCVWQGFPVRELALGALAGCVVGVSWDSILRLRKVWLRRLVLVALAGLIAAAVYGLHHLEWIEVAGPQAVVAFTLISGAVLFYVLTFAGRGEETEPEIALICVAVALALAQLQLPPIARGLVVLLPLTLFVVYCERIRRDLVVFKHVLRGLSHEQELDFRNALLWYRKALERNPRSDLAIAGNWRVHRKINLAELADDNEIVEMIDPVMCLERGRALLDSPRATSSQWDEAEKMLDIVSQRRRDLPLTLNMERLRLDLLRGESTKATERAVGSVALLPPEIPALANHELDALFRLWCKLMQEPRLVAAGGPELLEQNDYLFRFLATLEARLKQIPGDTQAQGFRPFVYEKLTLAKYESYLQTHATDSLDWLDYKLCYQLSGQYAKDNQTDRAIDFLRIAELGLPQERLVIWSRLAELHAGQDEAESNRWHQRIKELGQQLGIGNLSESQQKAFQQSVKLLAESARSGQRWDEAIENYQLLASLPRSGTATLEILKELYEKVGDPLLAIRPVELALQYNLAESGRRKWLAEKEKLYGLLHVDMVTPRLAAVEKFFDFRYCYRQAKRLFEQQQATTEIIRYLDLAALGGTELLLNVNYMLGRSYFRQGDINNAVLCLEQVKNNRPKKFANDDQEDAYFSTCRLLGDIYLDECHQPDKSIDCYLIYKDYSKSGAETLFRLGRAYEANGQPAHARNWYDMVLVYPQHPRAQDAKQALEKLKQQ